MAFTKILPQIVKIAKKAVNPIRSTVAAASNIATSGAAAAAAVEAGFTDRPDLIFTTEATTDFDDRRVRISMPPSSPPIFYKDTNNTLMRPLEETSGFIFPIQPDITIGHSAEYQTTKPTHSNFPYYHYTNSELQQIQITGDFPIRTTFDAKYVNAGIHFLRSCTRMFNSKDGIYSGAPPMVLRLFGLGFGVFDNIPVVLASVNVTYPNSVDHLSFKPFTELTETAKFPTTLTIQVSLNPVFSRDFISNVYGTLDYSTAAVRLLGVKTSRRPGPLPLSADQSLQQTIADENPDPLAFIAAQGGGSVEDYGQQPNVSTSGPKSAN